MNSPTQYARQSCFTAALAEENHVAAVCVGPGEGEPPPLVQAANNTTHDIITASTARMPYRRYGLRPWLQPDIG